MKIPKLALLLFVAATLALVFMSILPAGWLRVTRHISPSELSDLGIEVRSIRESEMLVVNYQVKADTSRQTFSSISVFYEVRASGSFEQSGGAADSKAKDLSGKFYTDKRGSIRVPSHEVPRAYLRIILYEKGWLFRKTSLVHYIVSLRDFENGEKL